MPESFTSARSCAAGKGVPQDDAAAADWFRKAVERGFGGAQDNLAIACALGKGVPKDLVEAYKWFALAATHGDTNNGADIHDTRVKEMTPAQIAEAEKRVHDFVPKS